MQHVAQPARLVLINWEACMYQIKQAWNLKEPKTLQEPPGLRSTQRHNRMKCRGVLSNQWGICLVGTGPNDPTEWRMIDSGGWGSARGNLAFRVGRNLQSKGAARPLLQRSSGQDYISTGSGWDQRKLFLVWGQSGKYVC